MVDADGRERSGGPYYTVPEPSRRERIAVRMATALIASGYPERMAAAIEGYEPRVGCAQAAVGLADALIAELDKEPGP